MKKYFFEILFLSAIAGLIFSCDNSKKQSETLKLDSLKNSFLVVKDSLDSIWTAMIYDDDNKLGLMKRVLREINEIGNADEKQLGELNERIDNAKANRFDQQTMANSDLIDEYDFAVSSLIKEIESLATNNPRYDDYPLLGELLGEIKNADNRLLLHRIHYDLYANEYNNFLTSHLDLVNEIDPNDKGEKRNLFQISD